MFGSEQSEIEAIRDTIGTDLAPKVPTKVNTKISNNSSNLNWSEATVELAQTSVHRQGEDNEQTLCQHPLDKFPVEIFEEVSITSNWNIMQ